MSYRLSDRAAIELLELLQESIGRFGVHQAARYRASMERAFVLLAENPRIARGRDELVSRARAYRHQAHMIVYREEGDGILIIRLPHARSDWLNDPD
ncbi:type II toxin-antitoxin system RelE/ParE family toxin [Sphingomonas sp.]|uniref:type II toxin-antitoxin system RelE/ParE family toxin n=1 Tax=Sphingomonas sp. TaxID=28214 RepID=UPI003AFF90D6